MAAPTITFREFSVAGTDPSGFRQYKASDDVVHASFTKSLGVGAAELLNFGITNITNSGVFSSTKVVLAHMDASGDLTTQLFNMKFWIPSATAFNATARFNQQKASGWRQNEVVTNASKEQTSTTLPSSGNILRQDWNDAITGSGDTEVTEWVYLSIFTDTNEPVGLKGGPGLNTFRYRLTADYY